MARVGPCARCGQTRVIQGRGLCSTDHHRGRRDGWLEDYPRVNRRAADFVDDYRIFKARGLNDAQIAERMGYRPESLRRTVERARKSGLLSASGVSA